MNNQYKQLTLKERYQIEALSKLGYSARHIAKELKRSNKTISNELSRHPSSDYCAEQADQHAKEKRTYSRKHHRCTDAIKKKVYESLLVGMTPEQIAGRMRKESVPGSICYNTIYKLIRQENWSHLLARKGKKYKQRKGVEAGAKLIPGRVDIEQRPAHVDDKIEIGHWEGDTVYGQDGYLVTLVERVSKLLLTCRVKNKSKKLVTRAINKMLKPFKERCHSITFDNGGEFADHTKIKQKIKCDIYFAKPYQSWQRGLNENTNGLLRRFFPKGMKIGYYLKKR